MLERSNIYAKNKFTTRELPARGRGGKKIEILLSSLPEEAIARYHHLEPANNAWDELKPFTGKQREGADRKAYILDLYHDRDRGMTVEAFAEWYNRNTMTTSPPPKYSSGRKK